MASCRAHLGQCAPPRELASNACPNVQWPNATMEPPPPLASDTSAVLAEWRERGSPAIPKILHQTWKSCTLPPYQSRWRAQCDRLLSSDWAFWLWSDADNRELIRHHFNSILNFYDAYDVHVKRVDAIRLFLLYLYGGVYMDIDFVCLRPFEALPYLADGMAVFGYQDTATVANAFMAAPPGHPFIAFLIQRLVFDAKRHVFDATGPYFVTRAVRAWEARHGKHSNQSRLLVHPLPKIYNQAPTDKHPCFRSFKEATSADAAVAKARITRCADRLNESFVTTFWTGTWKRDVATAILEGTARTSSGLGRSKMRGIRSMNNKCSPQTMGECDRPGINSAASLESWRNLSGVDAVTNAEHPHLPAASGPPSLPAPIYPSEHRRPIAACITGQARTLNDLLATINAILFARIRQETDIFVALSKGDEHHRHQVERVLKPRSLRFLASRGQHDGFQACLSDLTSAEQVNAREYSWVMRVRTDVIFSAAVPAYTEWPRWIESNSGSPLSGQRLVFYPDWNAGRSFEHPRWGRGVKDVWALMTRSAAPSYLGPWANMTTVQTRCAAKLFHGNERGLIFDGRPNDVGPPELALGCTLHLQQVRAVAILGMVETIVRFKHAMPWVILPRQLTPKHSTVLPFRFIGREVCDLYGNTATVAFMAPNSWNDTLARCESMRPRTPKQQGEIRAGQLQKETQGEQGSAAGGFTILRQTRIFDLGGSGLKTCILDPTSDLDKIILSNLGYCPHSTPPHLWIRTVLPTLDSELQSGTFFGISSAGASKLWSPEKRMPHHKTLTSLLNVTGAARLTELHDSVAHLLGTLSSLPPTAHSVVNVALGTGVACARIGSDGRQHVCDFLGWSCPAFRSGAKVIHYLAPHYALRADREFDDQYQVYVQSWIDVLSLWLTTCWPFGREPRPNTLMFTGGGVQLLPIFSTALGNLSIAGTSIRIGPKQAQVLGLISRLWKDRSSDPKIASVALPSSPPASPLEQTQRLGALKRMDWEAVREHAKQMLHGTHSKLGGEMLARQPQAVVDELLLTEMQRHPSFAHVNLAHVDMVRRKPVLLNMSNGPEWPQERRLTAYVFNPSLLGHNDVLVRVTTLSKCTLSGQPDTRYWRPSDPRLNKAFRWTVWLHANGTTSSDHLSSSWHVRGVYDDAEDARIFRLNGRVHMTFSRSVPWNKGVQMYVAALDPTYREVALKYRKAHRSEKNWVPIVYEGKLYLSYGLCPHTVLRCDAESGDCQLAYQTQLQGCVQGLRGGSPFVGLKNSLIAIAHTTRIMPPPELRVRNMTHNAPLYEHYVVHANSTPPFALHRISSPFLLPALFHTDADVIQFASGLVVDEATAILAYGLGDCAALQLIVPTDVLTMPNRTSADQHARRQPPNRTSADPHAGRQPLNRTRTSADTNDRHHPPNRTGGERYEWRQAPLAPKLTGMSILHPPPPPRVHANAHDALLVRLQKRLKFVRSIRRTKTPSKWCIPAPMIYRRLCMTWGGASWD